MTLEQESGDGSTNYQAARDVNSVIADQHAGDHAHQQQFRAATQNFYETHNHQIDGQDAREYLLRLFHDNFPNLHADAMAAALACAEDMAVEIVVELVKLDPALLSNLRKPRVQAALVSAQRSYAETGDPDTRTGDVNLGRVLARLVSQLAAEKTGGLGDIVMRQAIEIAPKITRRQLNALSVVTLFVGISWQSHETISLIASDLVGIFSPYFGQIPTDFLEYSYMSASGVGSYIFGPDVFDQVREKNANAMRKHFSLDIVPREIPQELRDSLIEHVPGTTEVWRVREDVGKALNSKLPGLTFKTRQTAAKFVQAHLMTSEELHVAIAAESAPLAEFLHQLDSTKALWLTPNAIGFLLAKEELSLRFPDAPFVTSLADDLKQRFAT
ncbi:LPO_1073/Vpar_1526 family protein [Mycolicibacterium aichiense]|uniref:LPO_1073/Vpar_1526 family protein n=1 Tax=Mycolicibacterium aichiense TaxID=1799 RepID=UPI003D6675E2